MARFELIRSGGQVKRYHTWPVIGQQTVAEHSWGVAVILMDIWPESRNVLIKAALEHDVLEYLTGDIPSPTKRSFPGLRDALNGVERGLEKQYTICQGLNPKEQRRLQIADLLELCLFAQEQIDLGNKNFQLVQNRGLEYLKTVVGDSVDGKKALYWLRTKLEQKRLAIPTS